MKRVYKYTFLVALWLLVFGCAKKEVKSPTLPPTTNYKYIHSLTLYILIPSKSYTQQLNSIELALLSSMINSDVLLFAYDGYKYEATQTLSAYQKGLKIYANRSISGMLIEDQKVILWNPGNYKLVKVTLNFPVGLPVSIREIKRKFRVSFPLQKLILGDHLWDPQEFAVFKAIEIYMYENPEGYIRIKNIYFDESSKEFEAEIEIF